MVHRTHGKSTSLPFEPRYRVSKSEHGIPPRALESLRKSVDEDGSPESEYALALALAQQDLFGRFELHDLGELGGPEEWAVGPTS